MNANAWRITPITAGWAVMGPVPGNPHEEEVVVTQTTRTDAEQYIATGRRYEEQNRREEQEMHDRQRNRSRGDW